MTYSRISPNRTSPRNHKIDTITIHCIVGQWTAKQGCDYFATTGRECSANYVVGKDGSIGLSVEEQDRSWCSSSRSNDHRAITIEVASDTKHPYKVTDQALAALIDLLVDICRRNGIKALLWKGDKSLIGQVDKQNMTVHRWFANKACPGDYLYNLHPQIAAQVNERLGAAAPAEPEKKPSQTPSGATFTPYLVRITASALNIRKGPGTTYAVTGQIKDRGVYTIVEQKGNWGRLKQPVLYEEGLTMGMKLDGLANFGKALVALQADIPEIMDKLVVGEGRFARDKARKICTEENIINTGDYRRNFNSSSKAIRIGTAYKIDVFNNLNYAKPLEYGFRGHFVPGHWDGKSFVYQPKDPQGGMFVHSLIPGHYTLERAVNATKRTQNARLQRRFEQELKKRGYMKYFK